MATPTSASAADAREYRIVEVAQVGQGAIRVMLEGITDANLAQLQKGKNVFADENDLPPPAENEFYYRDVIGCEVFLTDGRPHRRRRGDHRDRRQ